MDRHEMRCRVIAVLLTLLGLAVGACDETAAPMPGTAAIDESRPSPQTPDPADPTIDLPKDLGRAEASVRRIVEQAADAVRRAPKEAAAWRRFGEVLLANAYHAEALDAFEAAATHGDSSAKRRYFVAVAHWRLDHPDHAITSLREVLHDEPAYAPGWRRLAEWTLQIGDLPGARAAIDRAQTLGSEDGSITVVSAQVALQEGRAEVARDLIVPLAPLDGRRRYAHHLAAQALRRLGDERGAEAHGAVAEAQPEVWRDAWLDELARFAMGERIEVRRVLTLLEQKRPEATAAMEKLREVYPENVDLRIGLAVAYRDAGRMDDALALLPPLPEGIERPAQYWKQRAGTLLMRAVREGGKSEDLSEVLASIDRGSAIAPKDHDFPRLRAQTLTAAHDFRAARLAWEEAIALAGPSAPAYTGELALLMLRNGDFEDARRLIEPVVAAGPSIVANHKILAIAQWRCGLHAEAEATISAAQARYPSDASLGTLLEQLRAEQGPGAPTP